jgi:hypothetical protein
VRHSAVGSSDITSSTKLSLLCLARDLSQILTHSVSSHAVSSGSKGGAKGGKKSSSTEAVAKKPTVGTQVHTLITCTNQNTPYVYYTQTCV